MVALFPLPADHLAALESPASQAQMEGAEDAAGQQRQEGDLPEEVSQSVHLSAVYIVQDTLIVFLAHYCKLTASAA